MRAGAECFEFWAVSDVSDGAGSKGSPNSEARSRVAWYGARCHRIIDSGSFLVKIDPS